MSKQYYNLILGLAGPYAAGSSSVMEEIVSLFKHKKDVHIEIIKVSDLIKGYCEAKKMVGKDPDHETKPKKRERYQNMGRSIRQGDNNLVGKIIVDNIYHLALEFEKTKEINNTRICVFIIDSIKNVNEYLYLKKTYADEFNFIFIHANKELRWGRLKRSGWKDSESSEFERLDSIDSEEKIIDPTVDDAGQQVRRLAALADYFIVNNRNRDKLKKEAKRFIDILLGDTSIQPTFDEKSMIFAYVAKSKSYCLSRQVGAAIFDNSGDLLAIGHNDVPHFGGGLYNLDYTNEKRCYTDGERCCHNDKNKANKFEEIAENILSTITPSVHNKEDIRKCLKKSAFKELTEYCRAVHAEMEAILSLSRNPSISLKEKTIYVTLQPCHNCIKHIVCAGISKVIFIDPYPKSLSQDLHSDSIITDPTSICLDKVMLLHYEGISPKSYLQFFMRYEDIKNDENGKYITKNIDELLDSPFYAKRVGKRKRSAEENTDGITAITYAEYLTANEIKTLKKEVIQNETPGTK